MARKQDIKCPVVLTVGVVGVEGPPSPCSLQFTSVRLVVHKRSDINSTSHIECNKHPHLHATAWSWPLKIRVTWAEVSTWMDKVFYHFFFYFTFIIQHVSFNFPTWLLIAPNSKVGWAGPERGCHAFSIKEGRFMSSFHPLPRIQALPLQKQHVGVDAKLHNLHRTMGAGVAHLQSCSDNEIGRKKNTLMCCNHN